MLVADTDHRDEESVELAIRDLKDQALCHFHSGGMNANSAWTVIAAIAHNLGRWTSQIAQPQLPVQTARTRRRQLLNIPARLTHTSRQCLTPRPLALQHQFTTVLNAIRALPAPPQRSTPLTTSTSTPPADPARSACPHNPQRHHPTAPARSSHARKMRGKKNKKKTKKLIELLD